MWMEIQYKIRSLIYVIAPILKQANFAVITFDSGLSNSAPRELSRESVDMVWGKFVDISNSLNKELELWVKTEELALRERFSILSCKWTVCSWSSLISRSWIRIWNYNGDKIIISSILIYKKKEKSTSSRYYILVVTALLSNASLTEALNPAIV